ncbi:dimeric dihydrodiol dehydrogenase [Aspergillus nomiae NRRL 13137]|uniref:D-xylose 1-dehydrogenase (NADP(+), D-xylono-1,5-lactone-forming) n=1 Tax=Aspergillus nomiae NRRL (strain ATCC 15546 / NRRL 13137 / CBS 260.88 / M93) TaxID=1509407 RepID=A0A0L1J4B4_ASPN3|nr:dimeric dihydrodiol dehydrogenase [Aspergillus nomiae NRRL 13137]KNG86651.1 dimeric dihydrodiol dehydrogenase [Aspergillus nomiae NRRL 13137]
MEETFHLRWGILGTGHIAKYFAEDLLIDPATRERIDIVHLLSGVASSRSEDVAHEFMTTVRAPSYCQAYGNYSDLVNCPTIDVVYIATPHSHHFQNAMLALEAGKHVLCEKSLTVNAAQAKKLFAVAEQKQRFLMEGLWIRFLPVSVEVRRLLQAGAIGTITRVFADNGLGVDPYREFPTGDRMVVKELAGGALLDLGVYSIHWVLQALAKGNRRPIQIFSTMTKYPISGVDETTTILMKFAPSTADRPEIQATASASLRARSNPDGETAAVRIQGDEGEIQVFGWPWCPSQLRVIKQGPGIDTPRTMSIDDVSFLSDDVSFVSDDPYGLCFEADEVARCIRQGLLESPEMPWLESLTVMEIMDTVRRENDLKFPEEIETLEYPVALPAKTS